MAPLSLVSVLLCLVLLSHGGGVGGRTLSAVWRGPWRHEIVEGLHPQAAVTANFTNHINQTGWSYLEIHSTVGVAPDEEVAYMAGVLEATLTGELVWMHWTNTMADFCTNSSLSAFCERLATFIESNSEFINEEVVSNQSSYWYHVNLFNQQLAGLKEGYSRLGLPQLPHNAFLLLQIGGDLEDLQAALGVEGEDSARVSGSGSCSALVKILPNHSELFTSHDTWGDYHSMLRVFKLYDLKFSTSSSDGTVVPGHRQAFSSYPGIIMSVDDFYMLSSGLVTMETTIGNYNNALWKYVTPNTVFEGIRSVVANRLATSGKEWSALFSMYNSGTYNNQWMVVDYKLFTPGEEELQEGLLWVLEQLPGIIEAQDLTQVLRDATYFGSFNIPYYRKTFVESGFEEMAEKYGSWFTYDGSPRSRIYARNNSMVIDTLSMVALMRYNNFQHDPLSKCNCTPPYSGENAISARSDLNPANGTYSFSALGHRCHGGTDNKVTSSALFQGLSCMAVSGPTHSQQPVFQWSTSGFKTKPLGQPDKFDFQPQLVQWKN